MKQVTHLDSILKFVDLIHQFRTIERKVLVRNAQRDENDAEHSFTLAMLAWYINETQALGLDANKLFRYSLAHDLVEVYAGDTFFYQTQDGVADKHAKEAAAAQKLKDEFPDFVELHETISQYERREDRESRFVYALDKLEPALSIYRDGGRSWKRDGVTFEMMRSGKSPKISIDKDVEDIFVEFIRRCEADQDSLFNKI
jgi:putative hydrolase of HD superfamily